MPGRWIDVALVDRRDDPLVRAVVAQVRDTSAAPRNKQDKEFAERRLRAFIEGASDLLMVLDADGRIRFQAPGIAKTLGVAPEATMNQFAWTLIMADDQETLQQTIGATVRDVAGDRVHTCLVRASATAGSTHRLWISVRNYLSEPAVAGLLLTARDITAALAERQAGDPAHARRLEFRERLLEMAMQTRADFAQSLARALRMAAESLRAASVSFWRRTASPDGLRCESFFDANVGRFLRDWVGAELAATDDPEYFARLRERQPLVVTDTRHAQFTARWSQDPRRRHVRALLEAPVLLDGEVQGLLCVHHNQPRNWNDDEVNFVATTALLVSLAMEAAQRQEAESRIEQLAWYDSLTGLPNRNLLRESMRDMIMTAANRRRRIAVMLIDLDRFKDVNDTLGHLVGDALIKSAAQVLQETVGGDGVVARLGGDEFVVLVNEFEHRQEVSLLAARIAQALHRTDLVPNVDTQVSASIGVALFPEHGREMSTLLKNADAAMYQAKRDGRNQFSFFNPIRYERAAREVQLGIQLLKAVQSDTAQFIVEYQPQVEIATGRVVGFEALIRWQHPTFGLLTPDRFIGVAEVSGLSERITRWVVNEVCAQIVRWREQRPSFDIPVAVNVAGRELGSAALPMLVRSSLLKHGVEPRMVTLEITERTLVKESEINNDVMTELASLGVGLVLDDFGTGYSMLGYLKRMPIQAIKIDQSFIEGIPGDADSRAIVHAMLAVARHFKLKVVAEGIETPEQADYLRSIGCEYAQGYHYARALSAQTILEFVANAPPVQSH
jgi:diguanylate cyclase (GGDEF)-like protein/PAS domain S-box-containing protein